MRFFYLFICLFFSSILFSQNACNCNENEIVFSQAYVDAHQLIFRGKTIRVTKGTDYDKVTFLITRLFKGSAAQQTDVYFDNKNACIVKFNIGEDWLMYTNYKQLAKPFVAYCSRSRKNIINTNRNVELMYIKSDITVDDETDKLTELCGLKAFAQPLAQNENAHNNIIPSGLQQISLLLISVLGFVLCYFLLSKFLKKP